MRVLITGATGFVGRALVPVLAAAGHDVIAAVRDPAIAGFADGHGGIAVRRVADLGPDTDWRGALEGVEAVAHLAARVHVMDDRATDSLAEFRHVNRDATRRLAEAAADAGVRRLVLLSTVKVNGDASGAEPIRETDEPRPPDAYGRSKWEAEQALTEVARGGGMEAVILRPPLVYGPGAKGNFLALLRLCQGAPMLPLGGLENRRSLIYVGNLVDAIMACLVHPAAAGQTFLVRDGDDVSVPELIRRTGAALGRTPWMIGVPEPLLRLAGRLTGRQEKVARLLDNLVVDDRKIRHRLGWTPPFTMAEGLQTTAAWFRSRNRD